MKSLKLLIIALLALALATSCDEEDDVSLYNVTVELVYPDGFEPTDSVKIFVGSYSNYTDSAGVATLSVPSGNYTVSATESRSDNGVNYNFNGSTSIAVSAHMTTELTLAVSEVSQVIIKELYIGGSQKDDGSGAFTKDAYTIIYNNSDQEVTLDSNFCLGAAFPYNSNSTNNYLDGNGDLIYKDEGWIPAAAAIWHFQSSATLAPGEQIVMAIYQAINHTGTYSNSVDLSQPEYYCMYDIDNFHNTSYYTPPSASIPTSQYLKAVKYGIGSAWSLSQSSPAFFIFATEGMGPNDFGTDPAYSDYYGGNSTQVAQKVPVEWLIDAIDVFRQGYDDSNNRRFTDNIDAGSITFTNNIGHTLYRNVNQEATEAIESNEGLIVYNYAGGTEDQTDGSTDPSGIDAEASIKNGARIIYMDTNNSSNDFHQRAVASIK